MEEVKNNLRLPRLELGTSTLSVWRSNQLSYNRTNFLGGKETRTPDPLNANQMLYQLSYAPPILGLQGNFAQFSLAIFYF